MELDTLIDAASFLPESLQPPPAWIGHLPLAAWIIRRVAPAIFVELGTHTGNSYFSFCQSVVESGLATKCFAVDTWQGDEHAGTYDESIFEAVNAHNEERYAGFSRLLRMTFDAALELFVDQSIGLLHIDGLHTYQAVHHDFERWLPKLAPGAVVMFHDIGVREQDFGVWRLWEELKPEYPDNIELPHSHGLGILQLNNALDGKRQEWLQLDVSGQERLRTYFAALGSLQLERFELNSELSTSRKDVGARDVLIADLRQHASNLGQELAARDGVITDLGQNLSNLKGVIVDHRRHASNLEGMIADLRQHASNLERTVSARDAEIADLRQHASNLGALIAELRQHASNLGQEVTARDAAVAELRQHASNLEQVVSVRDAALADLRQHASNLAEEVSARDAVVAGLRQHAATLGQDVSARDARVASLGRVLAERDALIADLTRDANAVRQSTSWRITVPLRWVADRVKRARLGP